METPGVISHWNDDKGFGFIRPKTGGNEVFLHISVFQGDRRPQVGDEVSFVADTGSKDAKGRIRAEQARLAGLATEGPVAQPVEEDRRWWKSKTRLVFLAALCGPPILGSLWMFFLSSYWLFLLMYPGASLVAFFLYWEDKRSALRGTWRTSEAALHGVEFCGGWPGALIAQQVFRHKNRKRSYQVVFWLIVGAHHLVLVPLYFAVLSGLFAKLFGR